MPVLSALAALPAALLTLLFALSPSTTLEAQIAPVALSPAPNPAPPQTIAQKIAASKTLLDINTATPSQLKALPGVGDNYVKRIVAGRPYTAKNQLATRGIIPQDEYERIRDQIIAHRPKP
jgi:DNA uptake protein ComE-like DNA-binding protein